MRQTAVTGLYKNGTLRVTGDSTSTDAVSVFHVNEQLPTYFEIKATIAVDKPIQGWKANSYIIIDYQNEFDFKFAGVNASTDKIQMGHRTTEGWFVDVQTPSQIKPNKFYDLLLAVHGTTVTLVVDGQQAFNHVYEARIISGYSYGLNFGLIGFGSDNSKGIYDNIIVQKLPPEITLQNDEDFTDNVADMYTGSVDTWQITNGLYTATPSLENNHTVSLVDLGIDHGLDSSSILEFELSLNTVGRAGVVFDYYSDNDFKFAAIDATTDQLLIGHYHAKTGWTIDSTTTFVVSPDSDYTLSISFKDTSVNVSAREVNAPSWQAITAFVYNSVLVDGEFGLLAADGITSFSSVSFKTDDPAFRVEEAAAQIQASIPAKAGKDTGATLTENDLQPIINEAINRWGSTDTKNLDLSRLNNVSFAIGDLTGQTLAETINGNIVIDINAAGHGWFIDSSPAVDNEFKSKQGDSRSATPHSSAYGKMDLLSVVYHEMGHVLGLNHGNTLIGDELLSTGVREMPAAIGTPLLNSASIGSPQENNDEYIEFLRNESQSNQNDNKPKLSFDWDGFERLVRNSYGQINLSDQESTDNKVDHEWRKSFVNNLAEEDVDVNSDIRIELEPNDEVYLAEDKGVSGWKRLII